MGTATMGKVVVHARIENLNDRFLASQGYKSAADVRVVDVDDALVDTGTYLSLPRRLIEQLGLERYRTRRARTASGLADFDMYGMVQLTVQGRECRVEVSAVPDTCPVMIGQVPLEILDFVVDLKAQRLIGNPDHGGEQMMDLL